ncbi:DUF418 domain-containing protein [Streptomyces cyaneofuscatus]|uniref:DUF418 domain-containing protein n=1 Tax=Streptomyces cyaneofuscatus TaxID=66883 RepID=UPI0033BBA729
MSRKTEIRIEAGARNGRAGVKRAGAASADGLPDAAQGGPAARIKTVDLLRGFALVGILLVNARVLGGVPEAPATGWSVDRLAALAVGTLAETKFYLLFCFLFGYSTALLARGSRELRKTRTARYVRRLAALSLLGAAHGVLLFVGDILLTYAVLGLLLYPLHRLRPRTLLLLGCGLLALFSLFMGAFGAYTLAAGPVTPDPTAEAALAELAARYQGGPVGTIEANLGQLPRFAVGSLLFAPHILAGMVLGLAAGKAGLLERRYAPARLYGLAAVGALIGLPGSVFMAVCAYGPLPDQWFVLGKAVGVLTAPALTGAYVCLLLALSASGRGTRAGALFAAAGRLSLTHYLAQSVLLCLVFTGYGLGWYGRVGGAAVLAGGVLLLVLQLGLSPALAARFRRGPAEALVRRVSVGRG